MFTSGHGCCGFGPQGGGALFVRPGCAQAGFRGLTRAFLGVREGGAQVNGEGGDFGQCFLGISLPYSHKKSIKFIRGVYRPLPAGIKGRKERRAEEHTGKNLHPTYIKYKIVRTLGVGEWKIPGWDEEGGVDGRACVDILHMYIYTHTHIYIYIYIYIYI